MGHRPARRTDTLLAITLLAACTLLGACAASARLPFAAGTGPQTELPAPRSALIPTVNIAPAVGWPAGATPLPALGTRVVAYAQGLAHPRWLLVLPNGDVLVAESNAPAKGDSGNPGLIARVKGWVMGQVMQRAGAGVPSADRITLLRDTNGDGLADQRTVLLSGLHSPFGMALVGDRLFVANADEVLWFPYRRGDTTITAPGTRLVTLPGGPLNHHWTKSLLASTDGRHLYVGVGSNSNVAERGMAAEAGRAAVWRVDIANGEHRVFASGLRNPVGLAASVGSALPAPFAQGMFVGLHGSWNRRPKSGYQVVFVPFRDGRPAGPAVELLGGFLSADGDAWGRPVGVAVDTRGGLLVADDVGNTVWRVTAAP